MPHANASLTERGRLRLARCVAEDGRSLRRAADRFQVSVTTAKRWAERYRADGPAGMSDRFQPAASQPNPYPTPGDLIHIDIKKLGNIPDGGGHRVTGRPTGVRNKQRTTTQRRNSQPVIGYSYLHTAIDDHSRLAYTEILGDQRQETAAGFWRRAHAWFTSHGITIRRVLTDNGSCYRSQLWRQTCTTLGVTPKKTRPYRPQTNGKVERFHRTLTDEWAYAKPYTSNNNRSKALPRFLHTYNHHRYHSAIGGPPANRVPNLSGQNT